MSEVAQGPPGCADCPDAPRRRTAAADAAPRCGARRRRDGQPCRAPAMRNGRCHKHGGASTGWRSAEGMARLRQAPLKHGGRGAEARQAAPGAGRGPEALAALNALLRGL